MCCFNGLESVGVQTKASMDLLDLNTATVNTNLNSDKRGTSFTATHTRSVERREFTGPNLGHRNCAK